MDIFFSTNPENENLYCFICSDNNNNQFLYILRHITINAQIRCDTIDDIHLEMEH